jgi:hypothetical protein
MITLFLAAFTVSFALLHPGQTLGFGLTKFSCAGLLVDLSLQTQLFEAQTLKLSLLREVHDVRGRAVLGTRLRTRGIGRRSTRRLDVRACDAAWPNDRKSRVQDRVWMKKNIINKRGKPTSKRWSESEDIV